MLMASVSFFVTGILLGLTMAALHFLHRKIPLPLGLGHGALNGTGLALLLVVVFTQPRTGMLPAAAGILCVTALAGLGLISYALRGRRLPTSLLFLHASLALLGFLLLLTLALTPP